LKSLRQSQVIQRVHAIGPACRLESRRSKTRAQHFCRRFANPLEARLPGAIVEGQNQQDAPVSTSGANCVLRACLRLRAGRRQKKKKARDSHAGHARLHCPSPP